MEGEKNKEQIPASVTLSDASRVESALSIPRSGSTDTVDNPDGGGGAGNQRGRGDNNNNKSSIKISSNNINTNASAATTTTTTTQLSFAPSTTITKTKKSGHVKKKSSTVIPFIPAAADDNPTSNGDSKSQKNTDRIRLGICAMDKKARSKPMAEILSRLDGTLFHVIFFGDETILGKPIEEWPICDVVVAFHSKGYPLDKAMEYVKLRKPFILNDLESQELLKDRRKVYDMLEASGIDVPRHVYLSKDDYVSTGTGDGNGAKEKEVKECDDHIEINGVTIHKPFVEKPVDADDHNIAIYYPTSAGGGCKKLFRKIGNRSSEFYPDINEVRRDGSYLYEEFVETQGTDVKMYTVGPEYGHAEARKSPTVDGKVQRNSDGKEVRFPVILTYSEKEIARRIVLGFKQFVCGFDLLRVQEGHSVVSYVCDVNGWSFVKNSRKYYDDCAQILTEHVLAYCKPKLLRGFSTLDPLVQTSSNVDLQEIGAGLSRLPRAVKRLFHGNTEPVVENTNNERSRDPLSPSRSEHSTAAATTLQDGALPVREIPNILISEPASLCTSAASSQDGNNSDPNLGRRSSSMLSAAIHQEELRCVIAVIRHGDRTPKQKLKVNMTEPQILQYFHDHCDHPTKDLKVKAKAPMTEFLGTVRSILSEMEKKRVKETETVVAEKKDDTGNKNLTTNLEEGGGGAPAEQKDDNHTSKKQNVDPVAEGNRKKKAKNMKLLMQLRHMRDVLERWKISGLNRKLQIKPKSWTEDEESGAKACTEVQLILKWGGNLTKLGENQAIRLGQRLRQEMYPDAPGGGILRLHSTFRHDLKIKTSDEGRVMKTAAAFAKGLLDLEGEIPPILVSLVHKEKGSRHMLDPSGDKEVKLELEECKEKITANLQRDVDYRETTEADRQQMVGPARFSSMRDALAEVGNPRKTLMEIYKTMGSLIEHLEEMLGMMGSGDEMRMEGGEGLKGEHEGDIALSGVKLYKGETLLELTERWKFIYKRLYDPDEDQFDLSRIPDVHDNVRFDVLHNPHLGLTSTLEKLYELAKSMADCVVPQEYGTTETEKRSVGVKICRSLLEKIRFDLNIARTDNKADMRYMINMDYSADLPINTMGRRIRTRLYFTSESHLHTLLNVLRFVPSESECTLLSPHGLDFVNNTRELCYLTQIIIRLFEDTQYSIEDPKRFRVEILFSPGATATPLHIDEANRDSDLTRLDTAPLEYVGKEGLTCREVEDIFGSAIMEGGIGEGELLDAASVSTMEFLGKPSGLGFNKPKHSKAEMNNKNQMVEGVKEDEELTAVNSKDALSTSLLADEVITGAQPGPPPAVIACSIMPPSDPDQELVSDGEIHGAKQRRVNDMVKAGEGMEENVKDRSTKNEHHQDETPDPPSGKNDSLIHKYIWTTVAMGTLLLGAGCIVMALSLGGRDSRHSRRRYTQR